MSRRTNQITICLGFGAEINSALANSRDAAKADFVASTVITYNIC